MTTRIIITNVGPENAAVWYYNTDRTFEQHKDHLTPGQSIEIDVWDGHLPVVLAMGHVRKENMDSTGKFYSVPPAHY